MPNLWTRRGILKAGGLALFSTGMGPSFLHRAALAASEPGAAGRQVLVSIFQRGAMDGLMAVPPLGGAVLKKLRPCLAMSASPESGEQALLDLGVDFGLHPAFGSFLPTCFHNSRSFGISPPGTLSATGTRGSLTMPHSMASMSEKSLIVQGKIVPSA